MPSGGSGSAGTSCPSLVRRGQIELLGGGFYEPILCRHPGARPAQGQLPMMTDFLESLFGRPPARRVADRARLGAARFPSPWPGGGRRVHGPRRRAFPGRGCRRRSTSRTSPRTRACRLRVSRSHEAPLPHPVPPEWSARSISKAIRRRAGGHRGDDGEKFGMWPGTVQGLQGGLARAVLRASSKADFESETTFAEAMDSGPPGGRVICPRRRTRRCAHGPSRRPRPKPSWPSRNASSGASNRMPARRMFRNFFTNIPSRTPSTSG